MNSDRIKKIGIGLAILTIIIILFGNRLGIPINIRFFMGSFGIGSGIVLVIVANILSLHHD